MDTDVLQEGEKHLIQECILKITNETIAKVTSITYAEMKMLLCLVSQKLVPSQHLAAKLCP